MMRNMLLFGLVFGLSSLAWAGDSAPESQPAEKTPESQPDTKSEVPKEKIPVILSDLNEEFAEMARVAELSEEEQQKLLAVQKANVQALEKWDKSKEKTIARKEKQISEATDDKTREKLERSLAKIHQERERLVNTCFSRGIKVLTSDQKIKYCGGKLWELAKEEFSGIDLDEKQLEKAEKICQTVGKTTTTDVSKDPAPKNKALKQIYKEVLTKDQQKQYAKSKR